MLPVGLLLSVVSRPPIAGQWDGHFAPLNGLPPIEPRKGHVWHPGRAMLYKGTGSHLSPAESLPAPSFQLPGGGVDPREGSWESPPSMLSRKSSCPQGMFLFAFSSR